MMSSRNKSNQANYLRFSIRGRKAVCVTTFDILILVIQGTEFSLRHTSSRIFLISSGFIRQNTKVYFCFSHLSASKSKILERYIFRLFKQADMHLHHQENKCQSTNLEEHLLY